MDFGARWMVGSCRRAGWVVLCALALSWNVTDVRAQGTDASAPAAAGAEALREQTAVQVRAAAVRDDFVRRVHAAGFQCSKEAPKMVVAFVPSMGDFDEGTNTITTTAWPLLPPEQKGMFAQLAGPGASEAAAQGVFEDVIHRWMLVHELAHWWQTCQNGMWNRAAFAGGVEADRITAAYWREADPALAARAAAVAQGLVDHAPNPVPAGQSYVEYFNAKYERMDPSLQPWFAAHMVITAYNERPMPTLAQTLNVLRGPSEAEAKETLARVTAVRDAVVARMRADGFQCPLALPTIVVDDVPSFGNYDEKTNTLRTSSWGVLRPEERAMFVRLVGPGAEDGTARRFFDEAVHQWVFVHELGHWWQACRGVTEDNLAPYALEYGADRMDLAYWREADPAFAARMVAVFQGMVAHIPSPVPAGEQVEPYFNKNYETLGPSPVYPWFQARMIVTGAEEKPAPSFATVLAETKR